MRIRRNDRLLCRWLPDGLEIALPGCQGWLSLSEDLRQLLHTVGNGIETDGLVSAFDHGVRDQVEKAIEKLLGLGVLVAQDDPPKLSTVWRRWGQVTQRFHIESRDAYFPVGSQENADLTKTITAQGDAPPGYKEYSGVPIVSLPKGLIPLTMSVNDTFAARRTQRRFADVPLTIQQLSTLLFHSFAPYRMIDAARSALCRAEPAPPLAPGMRLRPTSSCST